MNHEDCIWKDKCKSCECDCEYYSPPDDGATKEYLDDLEIRGEYYEEVIKEQNE